MASSQRKRIESRRKAENRRQTILWMVISVSVVALIGILIVQAGKVDQHTASVPDAGKGVGVEIPAVDASHVADGEPVDSPSDPPTSGSHYGVSMPAGFYQTNSPEYLNPTHDGYLIHSLEHGYIIFWYNCDLLDETSCTVLKEDIQSVMDGFSNVKLIAFPRPTLDVPLVMTSWGYMQEFESFDSDLARDFIDTNRLLAPEPGGA